MFKLIEGTAAEIESEGNKLSGYELDSIQFTNRSRIWTDDACTIASDDEYKFYVAVFKKIQQPWD